MAQIIHNVSAPDDGLGDALRTGFVNQNLMNTELYASVVFKVAGYGLSQNDFTDDYVTKLEALNLNAEENVQADWNELDPTSDAYIKGKPVFQSSNIIVSAIWTGVGFGFDVIADAFPINSVLYPATPNLVTLADPDPTVRFRDPYPQHRRQDILELHSIQHVFDHVVRRSTRLHPLAHLGHR